MPSLLTISGAVDRDPALHLWLQQLDGELGAMARHWFAVMRGVGPDVREVWHDGLATVCVDEAPFAYVGAFTAHVSVGFFHGVALADPAGLLLGNGKRMRHVKLRVAQPVDARALDALIASAYEDVVVRVREQR